MSVTDLHFCRRQYGSIFKFFCGLQKMHLFWESLRVSLFKIGWKNNFGTFQRGGKLRNEIDCGSVTSWIIRGMFQLQGWLGEFLQSCNRDCCRTASLEVLDFDEKHLFSKDDGLVKLSFAAGGLGKLWLFLIAEAIVAF